jgi:hypothetical protein
MNENHIVAPQLPSRRELQLRSLAPLACAALATILTGMSVVTAFAAVLGAFIPMIAAGTFLVALEIRPDRSPLRAQFDLLWDKPTPNRLQHWYIPLIGAAIAGLAAELLRAVIAFATTGAPLSLDVTAAAAGLGALEGVFLALALALGFGLGAAILTPRHSRAA